MDSTVKDDGEVIELGNSEDDDNDEDDVDLTMDAVPFQEKVEKWLLSCNGAKAKTSVEDAGRIIQEKTVVVKEVIDERESLHSVDTEQYIKSNRRKTTTKITTTSIKKYYSMVKVAKNVYNNNEKGCSSDQKPINAIPAIDVATSEKEKYSCNMNRKSPRKSAKNLPTVPETNEFQLNGKKRSRQDHTNQLNVDTNGFTSLDDLNQVPFTVQNKSHDLIATTALNRRTPYNTRLNDEVRNKIQLCSKLCKSIKKPKLRAPVIVKPNQPSTRGSYVKLEPLRQYTLKNSLLAKGQKKNYWQSKVEDWIAGKCCKFRSFK